MRCLECGSEAVTERPERTAQGYGRFRCRACGKQSNERSGGALNRTQYPCDVIALVVLWRLRYKLALRDLPEMFAIRGIVFSYEAVREWEAKLTPALAEALRRRRRGQVGRSWYVDETSYEDGCVKPVLFRAGRHRSFPRMLAFLGAEVELRAARVPSPTSYPAGRCPRHDPLFGSEELRGERRHSTSAALSGRPRFVPAAAPSAPPDQFRPAVLARSVYPCSPVLRRPVSLLPCRSRHPSVRLASAPSPAARPRPGGIARARSGAFAPGRRS